MAVMTFREFVDRAYLEESREKPRPLDQSGYYRMLRHVVAVDSESGPYTISYADSGDGNRAVYALHVHSTTISTNLAATTRRTESDSVWLKFHGEFLCALGRLIKNLEEGYAEYLEEEKSKKTTLAAEFTQTMGPTLYTHAQGRVAHKGYWVSFENQAITCIEPMYPVERRDDVE